MQYTYSLSTKMKELLLSLLLNCVATGMLRVQFTRILNNKAHYKIPERKKLSLEIIL